MTAPDAPLEHRIGTREASRYLGISIRRVQLFAAAGVLDAIDLRSPGASRPCWSIAFSSVRRLLSTRAAEKREAKGANGE